MEARRRSLGLLASLALLAACSSDAPGPTGTGACTTSAECFNGFTCVDFRCTRQLDAGTGAPDATAPGPDTGVPSPPPPPPPPPDAGPGLDASSLDGAVPPPGDSGPAPSDAGVAPPDAFDPDAPVRCGALDQPCCAMACNVGLACVAGVCRSREACGGLGEPCCPMGCDADLTCSGGTCQACRVSTTTPGVSGTYLDSCRFGAVCAAALTITGSGTSITFSRGSTDRTGLFTLTGGVTASGTFTTSCTADGTCDLESVMGTPAGLVFTDRAGATGTVTLSGATASGAVTLPCSGVSCTRLLYVMASGASFTFGDSLGATSTITLSAAPICDPAAGGS